MRNVASNPTGGYQVDRIDEFDVKISAGTVAMFPQNGDRQSGPGMIFTMESFSTPVNLDTAVSGLMKNEPAYSFGDTRIIMIDGIQGRSVDFSTIYHAVDGIILDSPGAAEGENIRGRVSLVSIDKTRLFKCVMLSPERSWGMYESVFKKILASVKFIPSE